MLAHHLVQQRKVLAEHPRVKDSKHKVLRDRDRAKAKDSKIKKLEKQIQKSNLLVAVHPTKMT